MTRELKNPGYDAPTVLEFEEIPSLFEFFRHGGVPGVEYLFVAPENMPKAQSEKWEQIVGIPFFTINGASATIMARGAPLRNSPAQPGTSRCLVFADDKILEVVGKVPVAVDAPVVAQPAKAPKALAHEPTNQNLLATK